MGTTESIFADDEAHPAQSSASSGPPSLNTSSHSATTVPTANGVKRQRVPRPVRSSGGGPPIPIIELQGAVVGMQGCGKRTLLRRLEGKDPFSVAHEDGVPSQQQQQQQQQSRNGAPRDSAVVTVPYQPPSQAKTWERVRLSVRASESVSHGPLDFLVVMLHPNKKKVQKYLKSVIQDFLAFQGYTTMQQSQQQQQQQARPICLCLLLNFRDLVDPAHAAVQESNITSMTMELLLENTNLNHQMLCLQFGMTSLKNCYGLDILHQFIYQSYLRRKRWDFERFMSELSQIQSQTKIHPPEPYIDFVQRVEGGGSTRIPIAKPIEKKKVGTTAVVPPNPISAYKPRKAPSTPPVAPAMTNSSMGNRIQQSARGNTASLSSTMPGSALEAFLASSDDEEDTKPTMQRRVHVTTDSDSDDDDFFVTGTVEFNTPAAITVSADATSNAHVEIRTATRPVLRQETDKKQEKESTEISHGITIVNDDSKDRPVQTDTSPDVKVQEPSSESEADHSRGSNNLSKENGSDSSSVKANSADILRKELDDSHNDKDKTTDPKTGNTQPLGEKSPALSDEELTAVAEITTVQAAVESSSPAENLPRESENGDGRIETTESGEDNPNETSRKTTTDASSPVTEARGLHSTEINTKDGSSNQLTPNNSEERRDGNSDQAGTCTAPSETKLQEGDIEEVKPSVDDHSDPVESTPVSSDAVPEDNSPVTSGGQTADSEQASVSSDKERVDNADPKPIDTDSGDEMERQTSPVGLVVTRSDDDHSDDDGDFFIGRPAAPEPDPSPVKAADDIATTPTTTVQVISESREEPKSTAAPKKSSPGLSAAALAAIAAAQAEAELMLQSAESNEATAESRAMKKEKKTEKKKKKEEKKAKKKIKTKSSDD